MTNIDQLLDLIDLSKALEDGYVRERVHPEDPSLSILNYSEKAQYERAWTNTTRTCRGLIVRDGYEILARPWPKFFNVGEHEEGTLDPWAPVEVSDKCDGSLGILYAAPDGPAIATRGSFDSEQARHATALYRDRYLDKWTPLPGWTYMFEIVYPENRIVLDYGNTDDLILLGAVHIDTGHKRGPDFDPAWTGPRAEVFEAPTLAAALALSPRPNAEGLVVRYVDTGLMVKIKQDDYVRLHKLVTGLSERSVWEHLRDNDCEYYRLLASIPDEFHGWVRQKADALLDRHDAILGLAHAEYDELTQILGEGFERGEYASLAKGRAYPALLFSLLDGKDISPAIWKMLRPVGFNPMRYLSEDAA